MTETKSPVGIQNNNPGNLIYMPVKPFNGQIAVGLNGFGKYDTMLNGVRAAALDLLAGFKQVNKTQGRDGEDTVKEIITEWSETDQKDYIEFVCARTGFDEDQVLTPDEDTIFSLLKAIFRFENGAYLVADDTIRSAIKMVL